MTEPTAAPSADDAALAEMYREEADALYWALPEPVYVELDEMDWGPTAGPTQTRALLDALAPFLDVETMETWTR